MTLYQRMVGRAKNTVWTWMNITSAFIASVIVNLMILVRTIHSCFQVRKQGKVLELQRQLVQLRLESLILQELREQATRVGYIMDSSKITKQNLVIMIMAKGDDQYFRGLLRAIGHTSKA